MTGLSFLFPWVLGALAVVPALWWLLRALPPRPREVRFPAFFLLQGLQSDIRAAERTPWWLMVLRTLLVICLVLAFAEPVLKRGDGLPGGAGPVLVAVDNGWAAAAGWKQRQDKIRDLLPRLARDGRAVILLPTAPSDTDGKVRALGPMETGEAGKRVELLQPQPWPSDYAAAGAALAEAKMSHAVFLSDGTETAGVRDFMRALAAKSGLTVVRDDTVNAPRVLRKKPGAFAFEVERLDGGSASFSLIAYGSGGGALDERKAGFPAGKQVAAVDWDMPAAMRGEAERVALRAPVMASAAHLTDSRWRRRPVGIVADPARREAKSFLNEVYYLRRALEEGGTLLVGAPSELMKTPLSAVIWPDSAQVTEAERAALLEWVRAGGFLIRFAGPGLAANADDPLLPVPLRFGQRALEGALTWEKPVKLGGMPEGSPLFGLPVPDDVTVTRQVLAEPTPETFGKTWLHLEDGTPLITGGPLEKGVVALVHTTAGPGWSDFCYSGLFVEALQRMVALSTGIAGYEAQAVLPPLMLMDGFGNLHPPDGNAYAVPVNAAAPFTPSALTPPGLYGDAREFRVFNLGAALPPLRKLSFLPPDAAEETYALSGERSLKADLFGLALLLLLIDTLATLGLRGALASLRAAVVVLVFFAGPALAQEDTELASDIYLAYVETGDADADQTSHNGLEGLARMLKMRTTVDIKGVRGVDPASDSLHYYPLLYWPMTGGAGPLSSEAARSLRDYMSQGGMIVFDTRDAQYDGARNLTPGTRRLREISKSLDVPELMTVESGHILTRSFYLLDSFPGRFAGGKLWVEREPNQSFDAVTSVIIGSGDYAAAWSREERDRARFDITPGGERQREMAYRTGVNIVMTALAGNYKADQVHVPYILERLGK